MNGKIRFELKNGSEKTVYIPARLTSYNTFSWMDLIIEKIAIRANMRIQSDQVILR